MRNGVANNMLKWIQSYLFNRRARVSLDQLNSRKILLRQGVPQGGVLSPTLFLVFINDLVSELHRGVQAALYADDLVLWCKEEHASTANYRIQQAIYQLTAWTERRRPSHLPWCNFRQEADMEDDVRGKCKPDINASFNNNKDFH